MTSAQKIIKYTAIAFAIFLIFTIVSAILGGIYGVANIIGLSNKEKTNEELTTLNCGDYNNLRSLEIDINYSELEIKEGDKFLIETNNKEIECNQLNNKIKIKENDRWFNSKSKALVIYIPSNYEFDNVDIETGAGKVYIESIKTKELDLELGAGETEIEYVNSEKTNIDTGAGFTKINSGIINNLDFNMGVGKTEISAELKGTSDIDAGIGELNINLLGDKENYKIKVDKGVGEINIDNNPISNETIFGNGNNLIKIDGGIGKISINFINNI